MDIITKNELFKLLDNHKSNNTQFFGFIKSRKNWESEDGLKKILHFYGMNTSNNKNGNMNNGVYTINVDDDGITKTYFIKFVGNNGSERYANNNRHYLKNGHPIGKRSFSDNAANNNDADSDYDRLERISNTTSDIHIQNLLSKTFTKQNPLKLSATDSVVISELYKYTVNDGKVIVSEAVDGIIQSPYNNEDNDIMIYNNISIIAGDFSQRNAMAVKNGKNTTYNFFDTMSSAKDIAKVKFHDSRINIENISPEKNVTYSPIEGFALENLKRITSWEFIKVAHDYFKEKKPKHETLSYLNSYFNILANARLELEKAGHFTASENVLMFPRSLEQLKNINVKKLNKLAEEESYKPLNEESNNLYDELSGKKSSIDIDDLQNDSDSSKEEQKSKIFKPRKQSGAMERSRISESSNRQIPQNPEEDEDLFEKVEESKIIRKNTSSVEPKNKKIERKYKPDMNIIEESIDNEDGGSSIIKKNTKQSNPFKLNVIESEIVLNIDDSKSISSAAPETQVTPNTNNGQNQIDDEQKIKLLKFSQELYKYINHNKLPLIKRFINWITEKPIKKDYALTIKSSEKESIEDIKVRIKSQLLEIQCLKNGLSNDEIDDTIDNVNFSSKAIVDMMDKIEINKNDLGINVNNKNIQSNISACYQTEADSQGDINDLSRIGIKFSLNSYAPYEKTNQGSRNKKLTGIGITIRNEKIKQRNSYL